MTTEIKAGDAGSPVATVEDVPSKGTPSPPITDPVELALSSLGDLPGSEDDEDAPARDDDGGVKVNEALKALDAPEPERPHVAPKDIIPPAFLEAMRKDGSLSIEVPDYAAAERSKRRRYWCGSLPNQYNLQNLDVSGVNFPRFVGTPSFDKKGKAMGALEWGQVVELRDEDVERFIESVKTKIIRPIGKRRGIVLDVRDEAYRPGMQDTPLGTVLYMVRTDELRFGARKSFPRPLVT